MKVNQRGSDGLVKALLKYSYNNNNNNKSKNNTKRIEITEIVQLKKNYHYFKGALKQLARLNTPSYGLDWINEKS